MDQIRANFEARFGTEWSQPVVNPNVGDPDTQNHAIAMESGSDEESIDDSEQNDDSENSETENGPITVKHTEYTPTTQVSKAEKRRFMAASAPKAPSAAQPAPTTKEDVDDVKNDLALQRLIEESHILSEQKGFSGADISGAGDPLECAGKNRLKIMESRLAKAGAKQTKQRMPQAMAQGIKNKAKERESKQRAFAKEAGVVLARQQRTGKVRKHDRGLKINNVGRATPHGINVSPSEISRLTQSKAQRSRKRR